MSRQWIDGVGMHGGPTKKDLDDPNKFCHVHSYSIVATCQEDAVTEVLHYVDKMTCFGDVFWILSASAVPIFCYESTTNSVKSAYTAFVVTTLESQSTIHEVRRLPHTTLPRSANVNATRQPHRVIYQELVRLLGTGGSHLPQYILECHLPPYFNTSHLVMSRDEKLSKLASRISHVESILERHDDSIDGASLASPRCSVSPSSAATPSVDDYTTLCHIIESLCADIKRANEEIAQREEANKKRMAAIAALGGECDLI